MSRGTIFGLSAGTRRGFALLWSALLLCSLVLQYAVVAPATALGANGLLADTVQGFEIDGDPKNSNASTNPGAIADGFINNPPMTDGIDWNGVTDGVGDDDYWVRDAVDGPNNIPGDATPDTSAYGGGNKENDTRDWVYYNSSGPNGKTDYRHVMAHTKVVSGDGYVFVGADRAKNDGTMVVDFELNRLKAKEWADGITKPNRSVGDILISLEYAGGGSNPIVTVYRIATVTDYPNGQVVTFTAANAADTQAATRSATNWVPLTNVTFPSGTPYTVDAFNFAEASVNLSALGVAADCLSFQQGSIRSRTGGAPDASQLKDASDMFPLDLNTCGKLTIEKLDKISNDLVPGATFKIEPDPTVGSNKASLTVLDGGPNDPDGQADGKVVFAACEPGEYTVTEIAPPPGYFLPADIDDIKTILPGGSATFVFEDPLAKIEWTKQDASGGLLGGATFTITPNPRTGTGSLEVVDNGANDADDTAGEFRVNRVLIGGPYVVSETTPPDGYIGTAATYSVTVLETLAPPYVITAPDRTFVNTLGSLAWQKEDTNGALLLGATFHVTGPFGYDETVVDNSAPDADPANGKFLLEDLKVGEYTVTETAAPDGYILDSVPAKATVSATTPDQTIAAKTFVNHLGKVTWVKYGPDGKTLLGGATFSVTGDNGYSATVEDCIGTPCTGADQDATPGEFELTGLKTGTYTIVETKAPSGYVLDATELTAVIDQTLKAPYTVAAGSVTNTLGSISWVKNGPDGTSLLGGATFTITPNPQTGSGSLVVVDDGANDADKTPGEFKVEDVLVDSDDPHYSIAETEAPAGYVGDASEVTVNPTTANPHVSVAAGTWVNTLGSLVWEKRDADGALLGGATFEVTFPDNSVVTVVDNTAPDTDPDAGQFKLIGLKLGAYTVTETVAPEGYVLDTTPRNATLTTGSPDVEITDDFENTLGSLAWVKQDAAENLLGGATFQVTGPFGYDETVVDNTGAPGYIGSDADPIAGKFLLEDLKLGTYQVTETVAPAGYILDPGPLEGTLTQELPDVSIETPFVNTLGELNWTKDKGDEGSTPLGGATFSVTPNPYTGIGSLTVVDDGPFDQDDTDGTFRLINVPVGTYTVTETAAPEGYTLDEGSCEITVDAENPTGAPECSFSNPPIPPAILIVKTAGTSEADADQAADGTTLKVESFKENVTYKYVVTNTGNVGLVNVTVSDDKLGDITCPQTTLAAKDDQSDADEMTCYVTPLDGITADTTNIATAKGYSVGEGTEVTDTDDAKVEIIGPAIDIVKTAGESADNQVEDKKDYETEAYEDNVTYKYVVTNTGTTTLVTVSLSDDKLGSITCPKTALVVGESMTCTATATVLVDTPNIGTATGTSPAGVTKTATDPAMVVILTPSISIVKTAGGSETTQVADGETYVTEAGTDNVVYKYVVTNTGDTPLTITDLTDDKLGKITSCTPTSLPVKGDEAVCWAMASVMIDTENTAEVKATSPAGAEVKASDKANVILRHVSIQKGNDATAPLLEGDGVMYTLTFDVVNGPIPSMTVTDTLPAEVVDPGNFSVVPASVVGQVITWNLSNVADGATITYTATIADGTAAGSYTNTAEITEGPCVAGECDDDSTVTVVTPDLSITKVADADPILAGDTAGFTITVKNNGLGAALNVVISDLALPGGLTWAADKQACTITNSSMECNIGRLDPSATFTVHVTAPTTVAACGTLPNTATVSASNEPSNVVSDNTSTDTITVQCASISLVKTAGNAADGTILRLDKPGDVIFTYVVKNTGTAALENLELVDDNATPANTTDDVKVTCPSTTLAAGASMTCTATLPVVVGSRTNIAVVTANPDLDNETEVSADDDAVVLVPEPVKPTPKPTPRVTPPPTSTIDGADSGTTGTTGLLLVLAGLAGLMLAAGYMRPARATARKRSRRG